MARTAFDKRDPNYPAIKQLFHEYFGRDIPVNVNVAADDDMYAYSCIFCGGKAMGTMAYFRAALSIFDCVAAIASWRFGGLEAVNSFLDFASGHGRFTRILRVVYPPERIWASEILEGAVAFQRNEIGVKAIQSTTEPEDFHTDQSFDFIYVGSLFTHLPDRRFKRWLTRLYDLLTPNGILAFTTHGPGHLKPDVQMPAEGIYFMPETEIPSLDAEVYGATIVTKDYVSEAIQKATGSHHIQYQERALAFWQDLWILSKSELPAQPFSYDQGPQGHVDETNWYGPTELHVQGWAACIHPGHTIREIRVFLNGEPCGTLEVSYDRPDIGDHLWDSRHIRSGWTGRVRSPKPVDPWRDVISVIAVCSGGKAFSLRTAFACTMLEIPAGVRQAGPSGGFAYATLAPTTRDKLHRALDYALDGDLTSMCQKSVDFLRGR